MTYNIHASLPQWVIPKRKFISLHGVVLFLSENISFKMSSAAPSVPSTKHANNYGRLCRLLVDVGSHVLRERFDRVHPPGSLHSVLADPQIHAQLKSLQKKRVLRPPQWRELYPAIKSSLSSATFDSTLLVILLRNICGLVPGSSCHWLG